MEIWAYGESPLPEVVELAALQREVTSLALSLERSSPELERLVAAMREARDQLAAQAPGDLLPRVGDDPPADRRVYLDHSRDIGDYNPVFPLYELKVEGTGAIGTVEFPVCYEGPTGLVQGGVIALFFDCVLQQLLCDLGQAGKTAELSVRYRRPTPLLTQLTFEATRTIEDNRIHSRAELRLGDTVLCEATMRAAIGNLAALPALSPRRA